MTEDFVATAAAAARRVIDVLLRVENTDEVKSVAAQLDALADRLEVHAVPESERIAQLSRLSLGEQDDHEGPVTGPRNAIAPPAELTDHEDGWVRGKTRLGLPYQGPPGLVHGGVSALLLDHVLGVSNDLAGRSGMTASLTVQYHRPIPLGETILIAGHNVGMDGRKLYAEGALSLGDQVCVSAQGVFIARPT